jgi:hypothetical protein
MKAILLMNSCVDLLFGSFHYNRWVTFMSFGINALFSISFCFYMFFFLFSTHIIFVTLNVVRGLNGLERIIHVFPHTGDISL